jgi:phosphoglycerate dehydrogenase-like enzyme
MSRNPINILFINEVSKQVRDYLANNLMDYSNINFIYPTDFSTQNLLKIVSEADVLIGWRPTKELLENTNRLKVFINPGAGVKHLINLFRNLKEKKNVILINGHGNSYFVAQHAVALLLTLMNKIIPHHLWMKQGKWRTGDSDAPSIPLRFRKIGLLGYGAINQKVHRMLSGFDITFRVMKNNWKGYKEDNIFEFKKYDPTQLREFCNEIDTLIIAIPHTNLTENMIGKEELRLIGRENKNGLVVNVARGEIIEEKALYNSLKENVIAGAAIDVWYNYKPSEDDKGRKYPYNYPFHKLDNIILSPHRGYSPFNDLMRWNEVIENLKKLSRGERDFINVVDLKLEY